MYSIMDNCKVGGLYYNTNVNKIPNISCGTCQGQYSADNVMVTDTFILYFLPLPNCVPSTIFPAKPTCYSYSIVLIKYVPEFATKDNTVSENKHLGLAG